MKLFDFSEGRRPIVVSLPHCGEHVPETIATRLASGAAGIPDTDWHLRRLYDFAAGMGAHVLAATHSRYVIDLNRPSDGSVLYAGKSNTELCPLTTFDGAPVYREGQQPDASEVAARVDRYWLPYHRRLEETLGALVAEHGVAVLIDGHSIRSRVPRFFDGQLPDFNLGTADGASADMALAEAMLKACTAPPFTQVLNGRFKGGAITRTYGRPGMGVHAVQIEQAQATYMDEAPPFAYRPDLAERAKPLLQAAVQAALDWIDRHRPL
ncbi:MAG: N-formylglutamate deformylase [Alphaproteobacteria bacterium]|nr:N-formylglutamate deformylase [Alphaproteobacteria bacterium]